ncbi:Endoribonuclease YbeY [Candidatus Promineifilum breve]|uniref:Endoribonuclease YbeY n=1 Tax=Candidatus Promineifilum breve TaxID=1806508 RepID=A0A160SZS9_9CHLR|nr:rRNA maturation RNase YbeY [Candidatus Promineifilum breve]CUS02249.2 Endoribonuclease YbeY [Candidatus Promineifilum breve]
MTYTVDVQSTSRYPAALARAAAAAANQTMTHLAVADGAAVTLLLTDDEYVQELNRHYRGEDQPTDVLSFPAGDPLPGSEELLDYLGDIAIAVPFAQRQAEAAGHSLEAEVQLLAVHGVLHLLGHDHLDPAEKTAMWQAQAEVLQLLGLAAIRPTESEHDA